jgi:heterodisulfide reductase subunit B
MALPARNLALAEREKLDVLAPCAACYSRFRATEHRVRQDAETRKQVEEAIGMEYAATNSTVSVLELLAGKVGLEAIASKVTKPLKGMHPACYYGCLLVRPTEHTGFDDPEYPESMDNIMRTLGAEPVVWSYQTECCGASLASTHPEIGLKMAYAVLRNAVEQGADSIITACPLCQMNLDMRRGQIEKKVGAKVDLPVYYVTQMVAVACGETPRGVGINRHFVEALNLISRLPLAPEALHGTVEEKATATEA